MLCSFRDGRGLFDFTRVKQQRDDRTRKDNGYAYSPESPKCDDGEFEHFLIPSGTLILAHVYTRGVR